MGTTTAGTRDDTRGIATRAADRSGASPSIAPPVSRAGSGCPFAGRHGDLPPIAYPAQSAESAPSFRDAARAFEKASRPVYESTRSLYGTTLAEQPAMRVPMPSAPGMEQTVPALRDTVNGDASVAGLTRRLHGHPDTQAMPATAPAFASAASASADTASANTASAARLLTKASGSSVVAPADSAPSGDPASPDSHPATASTPVSASAADNLTAAADHGFAQMPRQRSLPLIGNSLRYLRDAGALLRGLHGTYGDLVRYDNFGHHWIGLHGADANQLVFRDARDAFSSDAWDLFLNGLFDRGLMLIDGDTHRHHRSLMQRAFSAKALAAYLGTIQGATLTALEQWPQGRGIHVYPRLKRMTLDIAIEVFTGISPGNDTRRVADAFIAMCQAATCISRLPIPGTRWWRGLRGRKELAHWFSDLLRMRREMPGNDLLSRLCVPESPTEEPIPDDVIIDQMIFLLMAAHDTTTSALTNLMYQLGRDGQWRRRLRRHSAALVNPFPDQATLNGLHKMDWAVKESLRMVPPLPVMARRTTREVTFKQWRIPANQLVALSPWATHYDPALWTEPDRFDPERFSPARNEHKRHPFQWVPFGGGVHQCIGMQFGMMEIKAILHLLLTRIDWAVPKDYVMPLDFTSIPVPKDGLPVALRKVG